MKDIFKEFKPTSWSIDNKTSIFVLTVILMLAGLSAYNNLPKEKFPDIVIPTVYVSTVYPGTSPADMENLVTKPLEKQLKGISGIKKMNSNSLQDFSNIIVEFNTNVDVPAAKQKVKDAVDKARVDLPNDLPRDPAVMEVDFSEIPIMFVNLSGDYDLNKLKKYADDVKDRVEAMKEITRVDIIGALDREIQVNVDMYKMEAANVTMGDIERAIAMENMTISGGTIPLDGMKRSLSVNGQFKNVSTLSNIIIRSMSGATIRLSDLAEVKDAYKEKESYARLDHKNVITLSVVKKSGQNLINSSDKVREIVSDLQKNKFPPNLNVSITGDQSSQTRVTLHDLINTIIIGFILVLVLLMFFMGVTSAFFVAMSVPLSMCLAFLFMPMIGFSLNMIVLFAFLLALGIVVDDAIVVIENTHRIFDNGKVPIVKAAKAAAGEVFLPVLSGTLTTLAPFIPLAFWGGIIGKFMFFLPVTLIITLLASLVVAYIFNPVYAAAFMKPENHNEAKTLPKKFWRNVLIAFGVSVLFYVTKNIGLANFIVLMILLVMLHHYVLQHAIRRFQTRIWPAVQVRYEKLVTWALSGNKPYAMLLGTIALFIFTVVFTAVRKPKVEFFPKGEPNFIYVYANLPIGTDPAYTDSITKLMEDRVYKVMGEKNEIVESIISNVAIGVSDPADGERGATPNKGRVSIAFVEFSLRHGKSTSVYLDKIREAVKGIPGAEITVDQERAGPPTGKPVNIEITGDDFEVLAATSKALKNYIDSLQIGGIEELKSDLQIDKPQLAININRERANREGISTAQIGMEIRYAVFGKEASKFKDENDEYPIMIRYNEDQRNNIDALKNLKITYRDMNMNGQIRQIPLSAFADVHYNNTYGGIKRKNQKRLVTLSSNVLSSFNPNEVVANTSAAMKNFHAPEGVTINFTGEQEEQKETGAFLGNALLISLGLILLILVTQFNSTSKPLLILSEILFSIIGVLLGLGIFGMNISIVMTGIGIVALAGIVVRNGILLVEFTDLLIAQGVELKAAIIEAGKTRMTPVILTASATILGLIPLAIGMNIDFVTMFTEFNPHIWFGGESVRFWGPLSWTMIFGLGFATLITLILVPVMYLISQRWKMSFQKMIGKN